MSEWPVACQNEFEKMAKEDGGRLRQWIDSGALGVAHLTFAAEALGTYDRTPETKWLLLSLLDHSEAIVREGAVIGLSFFRPDPLLKATLNRMLLRETSSGVKGCIEDFLEDRDDARA